MLDNSYVNHSIKCTVNNCKYNNTDQSYCSLDSIRIGTHEANPTKCQCTDCESFEMKNCGCK